MTKILIVDDDKRISLSIAARLRANGYEIETACDGLSAVMTAVREKPDAIVMDINMPAGNGIDAAERIQNIGALTGVPIIFITASSDPEQRSAAEACGASAFIEKPFESAALLATIHEVLTAA